MLSTRCGRPIWRITAVAAAASGGATMAPSAMATGQGMSGTSQRLTSATPATVLATAAITSPLTGRQLARRSRSEVWYAASSRTGATNSVNASSGSSTQRGLLGTKASAAPPRASSVG